MNHLRVFTLHYLGVRRKTEEFLLSGPVNHRKGIDPLQEQGSKGPTSPGLGQMRSHPRRSQGKSCIRQPPFPHLLSHFRLLILLLFFLPLSVKGTHLEARHISRNTHDGLAQQQNQQAVKRMR